MLSEVIIIVIWKYTAPPFKSYKLRTPACRPIYSRAHAAVANCQGFRTFITTTADSSSGPCSVALSSLILRWLSIASFGILRATCPIPKMQLFLWLRKRLSHQSNSGAQAAFSFGDHVGSRDSRPTSAPDILFTGSTWLGYRRSGIRAG